MYVKSITPQSKLRVNHNSIYTNRLEAIYSSAVFCPFPPSPSYTRTQKICSLIPLHLSKNIPEYKKCEIFLTFINIMFFFHKQNNPNGYIDQNWVKFSRKTTKHYQFFLNCLFWIFSEPTLSKICSFKSLWGADYLRWKKLKSMRCYIISYIPTIKEEVVLYI